MTTLMLLLAPAVFTAASVISARATRRTTLIATFAGPFAILAFSALFARIGASLDPGWANSDCLDGATECTGETIQITTVFMTLAYTLCLELGLALGILVKGSRRRRRPRRRTQEGGSA